MVSSNFSEANNPLRFMASTFDPAVASVERRKKIRNGQQRMIKMLMATEGYITDATPSGEPAK